jgi:hypothetical protein
MKIADAARKCGIFVLSPARRVLALAWLGIITKGGGAASAFSLLVDIKRKVARKGG